MIVFFLSQVVLAQSLEEVKKELEETRSAILYVIYYMTNDCFYSCTIPKSYVICYIQSSGMYKRDCNRSYIAPSQVM